MPSLCGEGHAGVRKALLTIRPFLCGLSDRFPCAAAIAAAVTAAMVHSYGSTATQWILPSLLLITVAVLTDCRRALFRFGIPLILAFVMIQIREKNCFEITARCGGEAVIRLSDPMLCGGTPAWMNNPDGSITGSVLKWRLFGEKKWRSGKGKTLFVNFRKDVLPKAGYDDEVTLSGVFFPLETEVGPGRFNFREYAEIRGAKCSFQAESGTLLKRGISIRRKLYDFRGRILDKFCSGMSEKSVGRELAASLLFGMKPFSGSGTGNAFLKSGTIHVLSVSGLHTGLFFSVFAFIFLIVPYRFRWPLLLVPVFFYTLSTGMKFPAERAFLMLGLFCCLKSFLLRCEPVNGVLATAALMLILNPLSAFDAGLEYSFVCVGILFLARPFLSDMKRALSASRLYLLPERPMRFRRRMENLLLALAASGAAWAASAGISFCRGGTFPFASVPAYLLMAPFAWLSFLFFVLALLLNPVPGAAFLWGKCGEKVLLAISGIAGAFSEGRTFSTPELPLWTIGIIPVLTAGILLSRKKITVLLSSAMLILFLTGVFMYQHFSPPETALFRSSQGGLSLVFCKPGDSVTAVYNMPDYECASMVTDYMKSRGTDRMDELFLASQRKKDAGGVTSLFQRKTEISAIRFPGKVRKSGKSVREILKRYPHAEYTPGMLRKTPSGFQILSPLWDYAELRLLPGAAELLQDGKQIWCEELPPSDEKLIRIH